MKKILLLLVTVLLLGSFIDLQAQAVNDWSWSHPRPIGATLRWCHMFDANTWYAVGYNGNFIKTTDGGANWTASAPGSRSGTYGSVLTLYDAYFFNMNTGLACGSYGEIIRTTDAGGTWTTINIGSTPTLYKLFFLNNNTGFVCGSTTRDVSKTTNGGLNWTDISVGMGGSTKNCIWALNANTIMVGESSGDVWRTTNGGTNWVEINNPGSTVRAIGFINSLTGFITGSSKLAMKTTNGGLNWTNFNTGLPTSYNTFYDLDFASTTAPPAPAVYTALSTNVTPIGSGAGASYWDSVVIGAPLGIITDVQVTIDTVLHTWDSDLEFTLRNGSNNDSVKFIDNVGGSGDNFFNTVLDDSAATPIASGSPPFTGTFIPSNPLSAFIGDTLGGTWILHVRDFWAGDGGAIRRWHVTFNYMTFGGLETSVYLTGNPFNIYKSPTTAPSWDTVGFLDPTQPLTSTYYSTSLGGNGDSLLTVGAFGFINKRYNASNRVNFRPDWTWMTSTNNAVGIINGRVMIPTSYSTIWYTTNNGTNWDTMKTNLTYSGTLYSISTFGNNAWVCGYSGKINQSTDGGVTWSEQYDVGTYRLYNINMVNANTGWVFGQSGRCYKTTNGGNNWTQQTVPGVTSYIYGSSFADVNTGWLVGSSGRVSKTTNGGTNWVAQTSQFTSSLRNIDMVNANTGWMVGYSGCIRKTTNGGTNWDTLQVPYTASLYAVDFVDINNGMVTGTYGITYRTRDGGTTWIFERTGGYSQYGVKMTSSDSGWACASSGYIFRYLEKLTGHNTYTHEVPATYELSQNYPNPFNPTTTIQFGLPKAGRVSLKIYDVSGRLVRTLVNNEGLNEGTFKYIFNGSDIASGVYFYSLIVDGNLIDSKKMVLIK